jgi:hypothetical protein
MYKLNKTSNDGLWRRIPMNRLAVGMAYREHERGVEDGAVGADEAGELSA